MSLCRHWVARILEVSSDSFGSHHVLCGSISSFQIRNDCQFLERSKFFHLLLLQGSVAINGPLLSVLMVFKEHFSTEIITDA